MKRWVILIIVALLFVIGGISLVKLRKQQLESIRIAPVKAIPVETTPIRKGDFHSERVYFGIIDSNRNTMLQARISGQVSAILKREGDHVRKGEKIIEMDGVPGDATGTRAALETALRNAKKSVQDLKKNVENMKIIYNRDKMLFEKRAIPRQAMELSENRWKQAKVQLQNIKSQMADIQSKLGFFTVKAPFDGTISAVLIKEGELVMPSHPLVRLENTMPCKIVASVSSDDLLKFSPGTRARILYGDNELDANLSRVYPSASPGGTGTVEIRLERPPFSLPVGASVEVRIESAEIPDALIVPTAAVLRGTKNTVVFVVKNGVVQTVSVRVMAESETEMAVEGKLSPGETVVMGSDSLLMRLFDGLKVKSEGRD